ncbi:hypothetical protein X759_31725 [Mesorhizobium sp. LSHC420B00]|nr:hypothetical protein X759_31725 [Mesorhizobium sp. LSHC420B00]
MVICLSRCSAWRFKSGMVRFFCLFCAAVRSLTNARRIRHYGLLAGSARKASLALARKLLGVAPPPENDTPEEPADVRPPCPCCGGRMVVIERFERWCQPRAPPTSRAPNRENTS